MQRDVVVGLPLSPFCPSLSSTSPLNTVSDIPLAGPLSEGRRRRQRRRRHLHISFIRWTGLDWTVLGLDCNQIGHLPSHSLHFILPSSSTQTYNRPARARILYPHCASNTTFQLQRVLAALYLIRPIPDNRNRIPLRQSQQPLWKRSQ